MAVLTHAASMGSTIEVLGIKCQQGTSYEVQILHLHEAVVVALRSHR